jgi:hypothetical protein
VLADSAASTSGVWLGIVGALGGSLLTGLLALATTTLSERSKKDADRAAARREMTRIRREAFADYLSASLTFSNSLHILARDAFDQGASPDVTDVNIPEYAAWQAAGSRMRFLLDEPGAAVLEGFEKSMIEHCGMAALGRPTPTWSEQTTPLLAVMRRALEP